jgi:hypothetical protein
MQVSRMSMVLVVLGAAGGAALVAPMAAAATVGGMLTCALLARVLSVAVATERAARPAKDSPGGPAEDSPELLDALLGAVEPVEPVVVPVVEPVVWDLSAAVQRRLDEHAERINAAAAERTPEPEQTPKPERTAVPAAEPALGRRGKAAFLRGVTPREHYDPVPVRRPSTRPPTVTAVREPSKLMAALAQRYPERLAA